MNQFKCQLSTARTPAVIRNLKDTISAQRRRVVLIAASPSDWSRKLTSHKLVYRHTEGGAGRAVKHVVTDYRFGGPGFATPKHVGWGTPQTPQAPGWEASA